MGYLLAAAPITIPTTPTTIARKLPPGFKIGPWIIWHPGPVYRVGPLDFPIVPLAILGVTPWFLLALTEALSLTTKDWRDRSAWHKFGQEVGLLAVGACAVLLGVVTDESLRTALTVGVILGATVVAISLLAGLVATLQNNQRVRREEKQREFRERYRPHDQEDSSRSKWSSTA